MKSKINHMALFFLALSTLSNCSGPQESASIRHALPNAEYPIEFASSGKAQLKDGIFEEPVAPGSTAMSKIQLGKEQAFGDVNSDGTEDAASTLIAQPGGSGTFVSLALVINEKNTAKPLPTIVLGDRVTVKSLAIQPGQVAVTMLTRKPDEAMGAEPTSEITRTFKLQGNKLVEAK